MKLVPVFPELFQVLISWSLSRKEKRQEVLDRKRDKRSLLMWGKILFFFQKYCRHFLFLRIYFCSWKTKKRNSNWCMEASGVGYEAFARRGQVYKRPWTPRRGNEVLIRFHSGVQKRGFISKSPVTCGSIFANPVVIPSGSSCFSAELKFRLLRI